MDATVCVCVSNEIRMWEVIRKGRIVIFFHKLPPPHHVEAFRRLTETVAKNTAERSSLLFCFIADNRIDFFERDSIFMKTKHCTTWSKKTVSHKCIVQSETHATLMPYTKGENIKPVQRNFSALEIWL